MAHQSPLTLITAEDIPNDGPVKQSILDGSYSVKAGYLDLDEILPALLQTFPQESRVGLIDDMDRAFASVSDLDSRYRLIYTCLRLASLMIADALPSESVDELDRTFGAVVLQGQTMTALWAIAEDVFRGHGLAMSNKPIQSDRYLSIRPTPIVHARGLVLVCDELIRYGKTIAATHDRVRAHLSGMDVKVQTLIAEHIAPTNDANEARARRFHRDVGCVLGSQVRPHSSASCYSEVVSLSRREYGELVAYCLTGKACGDYDPAAPVATIVNRSDLRPWNVTDPDPFWNTGITRITSLLGSSLLGALSDRLPKGSLGLVADARVTWEIISQSLGEVRVRFVPELLLNPLETSGLREWVKDVANYQGPWGEEQIRASADLLAMVISSVVFDIWVGVLAESGLVIPIRRDEQALRTICGQELTDCVISPKTDKLGIVRSAATLFETTKVLPPPNMDPHGNRTVTVPILCGSSAICNEPLYSIVVPPGHKSGVERRLVPLSNLVMDYEGRRPNRTDIALFIETVAPTWLRSEWQVSEDGMSVFPALRPAEVAPTLEEFGVGLHLASVESYADLRLWGAHGDDPR